MAAMKPRRPGRAAPPPPPPKKVARLAMLQMAAGSRRGEPQPRKSLLPSLLLVVGASLAGAMWMGGSLVDARNTATVVADAVAAQAGFKIAAIRIEGVTGPRAAEVEAAALPHGRRSLFAAEPDAIKQRVEKLDWVQDVRVARLWPDTLTIAVERREAVARWRLDGRTWTIDAAGRPTSAVAGKDQSLPLVIGAGAGPSAAPALAALEARPQLAKRVASLTYVHQRRWTVELKNGPRLLLPAGDIGAALDRFAAAEARYGLGQRALARVDLRAPGKVVIAPAAELSGAPGHSDA